MLKSIRLLNKPNLIINLQKLSISTNQEVLIYRANLFELEKQRQVFLEPIMFDEKKNYFIKFQINS